MMFEEPTSNTDISGKNKNNKTLKKNTIIIILKTSLSLKMSYVPILNDMIMITMPRYYMICCLCIYRF